MNRIDGFTIATGGTHGHKNDSVQIWKDGDTVRKTVIKSADEESVHYNSLVHEYNILKDLDHPNIIKVLDFLDTNESAVLLLPYFPPLSEVVESYTKEEKETLWQKLCIAVRYMFEEKSIVHCDIGVSNILLNGTEPILIDFQVARVQHQITPFECSLDFVTHDEIKSCCGVFPSRNLWMLKKELKLIG